MTHLPRNRAHIKSPPQVIPQVREKPFIPKLRLERLNPEKAEEKYDLSQIFTEP